MLGQQNLGGAVRSNREDHSPEEREIARETLQHRIAFFDDRGWLDRNIVIRSRGAGYRLFCSRGEFRAFRINHEWGRSPGVPCWPVCIVSSDGVFHDSDLNPFPSDEPTALQWLRTMITGDYEVV